VASSLTRSWAGVRDLEALDVVGQEAGSATSGHLPVSTACVASLTIAPARSRRRSTRAARRRLRAKHW